MATTTGTVSRPVADEVRLRGGNSRRALVGLQRFVTRNPLGALGGLLILVMVTVAVLAPLIATHDPYALGADAPLTGPSAEHLFGTDDLGRDVFSRVVYGARISLWVGFLAVAISSVVGATVGLVGAYFRGPTDFWLQQVMNALFAFPTIVLGLAIVSVLGPSITNVIIAVGIVSIPRVARVVRSSALSVMGQSYIEAARSIGCGDLRMVLGHVLPN